MGLDNLGGRFLKDGATELSLPVAQLIKSSVFPQQCKIAKLKPLYKKGSALVPKTYRPTTSSSQKIVWKHYTLYICKLKIT